MQIEPEKDITQREDYIAGGRHFWGDFLGGFLFGVLVGGVAAFDFVQSSRGIAACALLSGVFAGAATGYGGRQIWEMITDHFHRK